MYQSHYYWSFLSMFTVIKIKIYPVFEPNEYFWKHHYEGHTDMQKWEFYAKILREEIMAKSFNFTLPDIVTEDKFQFESLIKEKNKKKD
mmetsp:Transcript_22453/g.34734  ORF Transcript_22453/g.34734 Transcript_22453/m.34734 type:complete len:89 (-) Transcript_22453:15-281(-)